MLRGMRDHHRWPVVAGSFALLLAGCGGDARSQAPDEPATPSSEIGAWEKLPEPPLSGRVQALVASVGGSIVVAGGWDWLCPPGADCVEPSREPFGDGAAYDPGTREWRPIADATLGLRNTVSTVVGADLYVLSRCGLVLTCPAARSLLRYRSVADEWDVLSGPPEAVTGSYALTTVGGSVIAYSQTDEQGERADYRYVAADDRWVALPDDPLPGVYDRFVVEHEGRLMLFGTALTDGETNTKLVAAHDPMKDGWEQLADSGTLGFQVWRAGSLFYLNPHFRNARGGIFDPEANQWRPLPEAPHHDMAGVIADGEASYADGYVSGWVLDTRSNGWLEIEPRPDSSEVYEEATAVAPDRRLVVFGGQTWAGGEGRLLNDTWLWRAPSAR
jgi:Kelch motif protein